LEFAAIAPIDRGGSRALSWTFDRLFGVALTDTQAGFRALARALQAGARVVEVPVTRRRRDHGASRLRRVRDGLRILGCMLEMRIAGPARPQGSVA